MHAGPLGRDTGRLAPARGHAPRLQAFLSTLNSCAPCLTSLCLAELLLALCPPPLAVTPRAFCFLSASTPLACPHVRPAHRVMPLSLPTQRGHCCLSTRQTPTGMAHTDAPVTRVTVHITSLNHMSISKQTCLCAELPTHFELKIKLTLTEPKTSIEQRSEPGGVGRQSPALTKLLSSGVQASVLILPLAEDGTKAGQQGP